MTKIEQAKDKVAEIVWHTKLVLRVLLWQAIIILVACGVLYLSNYQFHITPRVTVISPITEGAK